MKLVKIFLFLALVGSSTVLFAQTMQTGVTVKRPNIVIIISDDHAYQTISAYGSKLMQKIE